MADKVNFYVEINEDVVAAAKGAAALHGLDLNRVVSRLVQSILRDYVEAVRESVPKPDFGERTAAILNPELTEDDIPF